MRALAIISALFLIAYSARAGFAGVETGNGVALTNGVTAANFNSDKSFSIRLVPRFRITVMEIQLTFTNGIVKRQTMIFTGGHALRTPVPIETVKTLGVICLIVLFGAFVAVCFRFAAPKRSLSK
jgi:hypothetical protein